MKSSWRFEKHAENGQEKGRIVLAKERCRICAGYEVKPSFEGIEQNIRLKIQIQELCRKWQGAVQSYFVEGNVQDLCKSWQGVVRHFK